MTYKEATAKVGELKARFDSPFDATDKAVIETLYFEVTRKRFVPTTCQQCYHDALIEIYLKLKKEKAMPKTCNYAMKAGFIISCPDFYHGKIFTNENLTDKVAHEYLTKYPHMESYFQKIPSDELIENKQPPADSENKQPPADSENKQPPADSENKQPPADSDSGADDTAGKDPAEKAAGSDKKKDLDQAEKAGKEE
ncbi:hypothetical protein [Segatella copri]|uniref:Uncharacterized protein n=1 Tax=Segatella copri TaxID=165179 RepID=A0AAW5I9R6_9BACT|nr:hypothetical protein [Segatella copri]MCP9546490.1 hypothetical protein [Segatella copri]MCP9549908.1 hypothetical protein [Segatella copri]MCP9556195.1 hypothetical protein [Segatella copri]MCP9570818.1 hypothetical protein [Segatella copri]